MNDSLPLSLGKRLPRREEIKAEEDSIEKWIPFKANNGTRMERNSITKKVRTVEQPKGETGFQSLTYNGPTGPLEILSHAFQKDGQAHIIVEEEIRRIGASDLDFVSRGSNGEKLILEVADSPASEMRLQSHQAIFSEAPRHMVLLDGITYT